MPHLLQKYAFRWPALASGFVMMLAVSNVYAEKWNYRQQSQISWREYDAAAFFEAKQSSKPLYVFVYSDSCSWCRKFETETLEKPAIRALINTEFIPVIINQPLQTALATKLGVILIPANVLLTPENNRLLRFYGFLTESALSDALNRTLLSWRQGELPDGEFGDEETCCPVNKGK